MSLKALYAAATGMEAQESRINAISNNLANINTPGYKGDRVSFEDLMYDQVKTPGAQNTANITAPVGIQVGHGTKLVGIYKQFSQGEFVQTNRELDMAVEGNGFFKVTLDNGDTAYSRDGSFRVANDGKLVTNHGYELDGGVTIPPEATNVTIGQDGTISASIAGQATPQILGNVQLSMFQNPSGLKALGGNLYAETVASGTATDGTPGLQGAGHIIQGYLENSNVNVAEELINMIIAQRSYEANSKVLSTTNEMMRASSQVI